RRASELLNKGATLMVAPFFFCVPKGPSRALARVCVPWARYTRHMEKTVRVFSSFKDADLADAAADMRLTPQERLQLVIELRDRRHPDAAKQGLARVCRI